MKKEWLDCQVALLWHDAINFQSVNDEEILLDYWRKQVKEWMASGQSTDIDIKPKANAKTQDK